ncbi:MAG: hypothetical protein SGJ19_21850 [Planctomycetia bacterium]|nr:hypothetical protein [Planctomycetia bacterium]
MMVCLRPRLFRRAALACLAAALGWAPPSALALMPWSGEGPCSALMSAGNVAWHCDFRDYRDGARDAGGDDLATCDPQPDLPADDVLAADHAAALTLPYDWQAGVACGPTDWADEQTAQHAPASVANALGAVADLVSVRAFAPVSWDDLWVAAGKVMERSQLNARPAATASAGTRAGAEIAVRTVAGQMSGVLGALGRQCLGAASALDRVAAEDSVPAQSLWFSTSKPTCFDR